MDPLIVDDPFQPEEWPEEQVQRFLDLFRGRVDPPGQPTASKPVPGLPVLR